LAPQFKREKPQLPDVDEFLANYHPIQQELCNLLRDLIRQTLPDSTERVRTGWKIIGIDVPTGKGQRYIGWVAPFKGGADLGFALGVLLDDPDHLLLGANTKVKLARWITIMKPSDIKRDAFAALIRQAADLASARAAHKPLTGSRMDTDLDRQKQEYQ
jgi:hypothetical protein